MRSKDKVIEPAHIFTTTTFYQSSATVSRSPEFCSNPVITVLTPIFFKVSPFRRGSETAACAHLTSDQRNILNYLKFRTPAGDGRYHANNARETFRDC